jgi:hypothetical protein
VWCKEGKLQQNQGKTFCDDVKRSYYVRNNVKHQCPLSLVDEAVCESGILKYKDNFWHDGLDLAQPIILNEHTTYAFSGGTLTSMSKFYRCRGQCSVDEHSGNITCPLGTHGVLCGLCNDGFFPALNGHCEPCQASGSDVVTQGWLFLILGALAVGISSVLLYRRLIKNQSFFLDLFDQLSSKFKLTTAFFSIALMTGSAYEIRWPQGYLDFLSFFAVFAFDLFGTIKLGCIVSYDADSAMYALSTLLLTLELGIMVGIWSSKSSATASFARRLVALELLLTYLFYPFGCKVLFSTFDCVEVDGVGYLRSDLRIDCASKAHGRAQAFAAFMILAFPIGLPLLYFGLLWRHREQLFDEEGTMSFMRFFYKEYERKFYYW